MRYRRGLVVCTSLHWRSDARVTICGRVRSDRSFIQDTPKVRMMHIVVAIDRSAESQNALANAIDIVDTFEGSITAVHVAEDEKDESASAILERAVERGETREVRIDTERLSGDPVDSIARYAEEADADAIYVGHRGLTSEGREIPGDSRGPLGSVAKGLVERTPIPVTVFDRGL